MGCCRGPGRGRAAWWGRAESGSGGVRGKSVVRGPGGAGGGDKGETFGCAWVVACPDAGATTGYYATASQIVADASAAPGLEANKDVYLIQNSTLRKACGPNSIRCECDFTPDGKPSL